MNARPLLTALFALAAAAPAEAQFFKDKQLEAARGPAELKRLVRERLASAPNDPQTVLAAAVVALDADDAAPRKAAIARAEACVKALPQAAECHFAQGALLGVQAMSEGMLAAARSMGPVRDALTTALTLEPQWYPARSALVLYYLELPGLLGGSTSKAGELAAGAASPEQAKALQARVALKAGKADAAVAALLPLAATTDTALADDVRDWLEQAGHQLVNDGAAAKALPAFERLARDRAAEAGGVYGLARVRHEQGAFEDAARLYEKAATLERAERYPIDYRRGLALQKLGRNDAAKQAYERFVAAGKGRKSQIEDAKKRLSELST
jgi:tetratricopeptide (TPR) repeat protein